VGRPSGEERGKESKTDSRWNRSQRRRLEKKGRRKESTRRDDSFGVKVGGGKGRAKGCEKK